MKKQDVQFKWDTKSFDGMIRNLEGFQRKVRNKVIRETVREAGGIFVKELKASTPRHTGMLRRNIKQKVKTKRNYIYTIFGAKWVGESGSTKGKNPAIYMHVLEHGGKKRSRGTNPFAKSAFKRKRSMAASLVKRRLADSFKRAEALAR